MRLTLDGEGRLLRIRGDKAHPITEGYSCAKGLCHEELHNSPERLLRPLKRRPDGGFDEISLDQALDEIAERLARLGREAGPASIASFLGTAGYGNATAAPMLRAFMDAVGSPSRFTSLTIDQSAKIVTIGRLGRWAAGRQDFDESDVWMIWGSNPLVSLSQTAGVSASHPLKQIKAAKARGLRLVVVDPRRTETARYADIHLQPYPGEDAALAAGLLNLMLSRGLHDSSFCDRYVEGLEALRAAVAPFTPELVEQRTGVPAAQQIAAAELWGGAGKTGCAASSTGPCMAPWSNLSEHLIELMNVVCGRYRRPGDRAVAPLLPGSRRAEPVGPARWWDRGPRSRIGGFGTLPGVTGRELPCGVMASEILTPGEGRIRSLFVVGGNPALAFPDQRKVVEALQALDLLVTLDPFLSATARLSHYVIPPRLQYERADAISIAPQLDLSSKAFLQFSRGPVAPPPGSEVIDDWRLFWELARRLGLSLSLEGVPLDSETPPATRDLLRILTRHRDIDFDALWAEPGGELLTVSRTVEPGRAENQDRFAALPDDVAEELDRYAAAEPRGGRPGAPFSHLLASRRMRDAINSVHHEAPTIRRRGAYNPAYLHPDDIAALGLAPGAKVEIVSDHGRIPAILAADETLRSGVVQMSHAWGALPDEAAPYEAFGANIGLLIDSNGDIEPINAMARQSAIPVNIVPWPGSPEVGSVSNR